MTRLYGRRQFYWLRIVMENVSVYSPYEVLLRWPPLSRRKGLLSKYLSVQRWLILSHREGGMVFLFCKPVGLPSQLAAMHRRRWAGIISVWMECCYGFGAGPAQVRHLCPRINVGSGSCLHISCSSSERVCVSGWQSSQSKESYEYYKDFILVSHILIIQQKKYSKSQDGDRSSLQPIKNGIYRGKHTITNLYTRTFSCLHLLSVDRIERLALFIIECQDRSILAFFCWKWWTNAWKHQRWRDTI